LGTTAISRGVVEIKQAGSTVQSNRFCADGPLPPQFATLFPVGDRQVDHWMDMRWDPPGAMLLEVGVTLAGRPRDEGVALSTTHIVTPETAKSTHYFHASSRNFRIDDAALTTASRERQRRAFVDEDKPMLEAQQRMIGDADFQSLKPVLLGSDAGSARVRRVLERLILIEQRQREESTQTTTATA
jgi:vanillate O-demethylase monooxygenase subunit